MPWVDIAEAAFTLGVSERTIRNWIKSGKLEARNADGRREVNIPDAEESQRAQAFGEDEGEDSLGTQKRLEVALIECGRVKGTLASQERMMESLSANIAELNAKLQRSERTIGTRTIYCLVVAFLGVLTVMMVRYFDEAKYNDATVTHAKEQKNLSDNYAGDLKTLEENHRKELANLRAEMRQTIKQTEDELEEKRLKDLEKLEAKLQARHREELAKQIAITEKLQKERDTLLLETGGLKGQLEATTTKQVLNETRLAEAQDRIAELEKTRSELESEIVRLKTGQ